MLNQIMDGAWGRLLIAALLTSTVGCASGAGRRMAAPPIGHAIAPLPAGPLSLDDLVRHALDNQPELQLARDKVAVARAKAPRPRAPDVMTVSFGPVPSPWPGARPPASPEEAEARADLARAEAAVVADVKRCYWQLMALRGEGEALREGQQYAEAMLMAARGRVQDGGADSRDAILARNVLQKLDEKIQGIRLRESYFQAELARVMIAPSDAALELLDPPMGLEIPSSLPALEPLLDRATHLAGADRREQVRQLHAQARQSSETVRRNRDVVTPRAQQAFDVALQDYSAGRSDYARLDSARRDLAQCRLDVMRGVPALQTTLATLEQAVGAAGWPPAGSMPVEPEDSTPRPEPRRVAMAPAPEPPTISPDASLTSGARRAIPEHSPLVVPPILLPTDEPAPVPPAVPGRFTPFTEASADRLVKPTSTIQPVAAPPPRIELGAPILEDPDEGSN